MRPAALVSVVGLLVAVAGCERTYGPLPEMPTASVPAATTLLHNKIYSTGKLPAVACKLPAGALGTRAAVQRYASTFQDCLQRAWKPMIERLDFGYLPPTVYAVAIGTRTACGVFEKDDEAYYCSANSGIYLDWNALTEEEPDERATATIYLQYVMAHEFGHHVQDLAGISAAFDERWQAAKGSARLEQMRRHELQATCFGAAFMGANQKTLDLYGPRLEIYQWAADSGDDDPPAGVRDHGSRKSNTAWSDAAFTARSPSACNTWSAPPGRVS